MNAYGLPVILFIFFASSFSAICSFSYDTFVVLASPSTESTNTSVECLVGDMSFSLTASLSSPIASGETRLRQYQNSFFTTAPFLPIPHNSIQAYIHSKIVGSRYQSHVVVTFPIAVELLTLFHITRGVWTLLGV